MQVYRIERERYLHATLEGVGASLSSGFRWNSMHTRLVYTAQSRALSMLEVAVHLDWSEDLPSDRYYVEIDIPDELLILEVAIDDLPLEWDAKPPTKATQFIGDTFVRQREAAVLKVPSAIVPFEHNYLINPLHPDAQRIQVVSSTRMVFDRRVGKVG